MHETIYVVDFGGQYNQLIARRVREQGVYSEVISYKRLEEKINEKKPIGLIFTGGPNSVYEESSPKIDKKIIENLKVPVLGLCYGMQLLTYLFGGKVEKTNHKEFGKVEIKI